MTTFIANILAEGDGEGIGPLIGILIMATIGVISAVVKKVKGAAEQREQIRRGPAPKAEPTEESDGRPVNAREAMARAALKSMGIVTEPEAPPPPPQPKPVRRHRAPAAPAPGQTSMGPVVEPTVDDHVEEHILAGIRKKVAAPVAETKVKVDLSSSDKLRQAIVLHEILAAPKGLRQERELWDNA